MKTRNPEKTFRESAVILTTQQGVEPDNFRWVHRFCGEPKEVQIATSLGEIVIAEDEMARLLVQEVLETIVLECLRHGIRSAPLPIRHYSWTEPSSPFPDRMRTVILAEE